MIFNSAWQIANVVYAGIGCFSCRVSKAHVHSDPCSENRGDAAPTTACFPVLRLLATLMLLPVLLHAAPVRVIEESAIPYMSFLSKVDFDQRYPGELLDDPSKLNTGWYVIYQHETLNYYFGPILLESIGEDYLAQLTDTVEAAVAQRPTIQDYRLELSYEPSTSSLDSSSAEPSAEPSMPNPLPPQTPPKPSFWSFIKKIFGFG